MSSALCRSGDDMLPNRHCLNSGPYCCTAKLQILGVVIPASRQFAVASLDPHADTGPMGVLLKMVSAFHASQNFLLQLLLPHAALLLKHTDSAEQACVM